MKIPSRIFQAIRLAFFFIFLLSQSFWNLAFAQCEFSAQSDGERAYFFSLEADWQLDSEDPEWFINGVRKSTYPNFSYIFIESGEYEVCISVNGPNCQVDECINLSFENDWFDDPADLGLNTNFLFTGSHLIVESPNAANVNYRWGLESSTLGSVNVGVSLGYGIFLTEDICSTRMLSVVMEYSEAGVEETVTYDFMVNRICSCNTSFPAGSADDYISNVYFSHSEDPSIGDYYWWLINHSTSDTTVLTDSSYDLDLELGDYRICLIRDEQYCADTYCRNIEIDCGANLYVEPFMDYDGLPDGAFISYYIDNEDMDYEFELTVNGDSISLEEFQLFLLPGYDTTLYEICLSAVTENCAEIECESFQQYCPIEIFDYYENGQFLFTHSNEESDKHYWTINNQSAGVDDTLFLSYDDSSSYKVCVNYAGPCNYYDCYFINYPCSVNLYETWEGHIDLNQPAYPGTYTWTINEEAGSSFETDVIQSYEETGYGYFDHIDVDCGIFDVCVSFVSDPSSFFNLCESQTCLTVENVHPLYETWELSDSSTEGQIKFELTSSLEEPEFAIVEWNLFPSDESQGLYESLSLDYESNTMIWEPVYILNPEIDYEICLDIYTTSPTGIFCEETLCKTIKGDCPPCALCDPNSSENLDCICEDLIVIYEADCLENSYDLIFSFISEGSGITLTNQLTGTETALPATGTHTISGLPFNSPYAYTLVLNDDATCNFLAESSMVTCGTVNIELLNFSGLARATENYLSWSTASENNCAAFILERSENGRDFYPIAELDCAGESSSTQNYEFVDGEFSGSVAYYRLIEKEESGRLQVVSKVIAMERSQSMSLSLHPNPVLDIVTIELPKSVTEFEDQLLISIYNVNGQLISEFSKQKEINQRLIKLSMEGLASGIYYLSINSNQTQMHQRLVKE